jgi:hypothetical protein
MAMSAGNGSSVKLPMRFAYADPPYPGQAKRLYGNHGDYAGEVDHRELIERLEAEYPDGWALSTGAKMLPEVLRLCPVDVRVLAWVKTDAPPFRTRVQYTWEPVILRGGRRYDGGPRIVRDSLVAPSCGAMGPGVYRNPNHLVGRKPPRFCRWLFECLGAGPGDTLDDLYPGSGDVLLHWSAFEAQGSLL